MEEQKPKIVQNLNKEKTEVHRLITMTQVTKIIVDQPKSAEAAAGALAGLITCAYYLAKSMWGSVEAARAIKIAVDLQVAEDKAKEQAN